MDRAAFCISRRGNWAVRAMLWPPLFCPADWYFRLHVSPQIGGRFNFAVPQRLEAETGIGRTRAFIGETVANCTYHRLPPHTRKEPFAAQIRGAWGANARTMSRDDNRRRFERIPLH